MKEVKTWKMGCTMYLIVVVVGCSCLRRVIMICRFAGLGRGGDPVAEGHFLVVLIRDADAASGGEETAETAVGGLEVLVSKTG